MQPFVLIMMLVVTVAPYAADSLGDAPLLKYFPELLSAVALVWVLLEGTRRRFHGVAPKYWLLFAVTALVLGCSVITNGVGTAPLITGLRFYLRALPFFFLPAVFDFTEEQVGQQLGLLMLIAVAQFPLAAYQRWDVLSQGRYSGDAVQGTLLDSGVLSVFLICSALVATGLFLRGRLRRAPYFALLLLLLAPTTINETKVSILYVPFGFAITVMVGAEPGRRLRYLGCTAALLALFGSLFVVVYDRMEVNNPRKNERSIVGFFSNQKQIDRYLTSNVTGVGTKKDIRRGDAIDVPLAFLAKDPIRLALGVGLGNTSASSIRRADEGAYYELFRGFLITSFSDFLLEIGILGLTCLLLLYCMLFMDALQIARQPGLIGAVAVGWSASICLMCLSLLYSQIHLSAPLSYLFWYFSGLVAAQRMRSPAQQQSLSNETLATDKLHLGV